MPNPKIHRRLIYLTNSKLLKGKSTSTSSTDCSNKTPNSKSNSKKSILKCTHKTQPSNPNKASSKAPESITKPSAAVVLMNPMINPLSFSALRSSTNTSHPNPKTLAISQDLSLLQVSVKFKITKHTDNPPTKTKINSQLCTRFLM